MSRRKFWIAALCLGFMTLVGGQSLLASGLERPEQDELKARMQAEGWTQISDGVYERWRGATKVEHLGYGREGLAWTIRELERRRERLIQEYQSFPSEELADVIDELSVTIAKAELELRNTPRGVSSMSAAVTGPSCSNICYTATADAYYLTTTQGVGAIADAKFKGPCGYSGNTYAYAYARATLNGTMTTVTQEDPRSGTSATSHAAATVGGSNDCYSEAYSSVQSTALEIVYSTSDVNSGICPVPPPPVPTISGPTSVTFTSVSCATQTWTSTVSGGVTPYSYQWYYNNTAVGTGTSYSRSVCHGNADFQLKLVVTGSNGQSGSDTHDVTMYYDECGTAGTICRQ